MNRLRAFLAVALLWVVVSGVPRPTGSAVPRDEPLDTILFVSASGTDAVRTLLRAEVTVSRRLPTGVLVFGNARTADRVTTLGFPVRVLEQDIGDREHYIVWGDPTQLDGAPGPMQLLTADEDFSVVSIPRGAVERIAGLGNGIERLFRSSLRLREDHHRVVPKAPRMSPAPTSSPFIAGLVSQVSEDTLVNNVLTLEGFGTRRATSSQGHAAAAWLRKQFLSYGITDVEIHQWDPAFPGNVIATIPGTDPQAGVYILGGHFDSIVPESNAAPGADDNATGTATVLECARILAPHQFEATIRFIGFSAEELGLLGSAAYANRSSERGEFINAMINVDMLGYRAAQDTRDLDLILSPTSDWLRLEAIAAQENYVPDFSVVSGKLLRGSSDHASFEREGFDAIFLHEDSGNSSPYIHTLNDIFGTSYNDPILHTQSTRIALAMLSALAQPVAVPIALESFIALQEGDGIVLTWEFSWQAEQEISEVQIERATNAAGPFERLTPGPLAPTERRYVDTHVESQPAWWYRLAMRDVQGQFTWSSPIRVVLESRGLQTSLDAPFWSDSADRLQIRYRIGPTARTANLGVFDVRGRQVRQLADGPHAPGEYLRTWDGRDASGRSVGRGVYVVRLGSGHASLGRKVVVLGR